MPGGRTDPDPPTRAELALGLIVAHDRAFRRTANRHSICVDDAEDAYGRALEILLTKGPFHEPGRLAAWMHVVTRREAMAVRRGRERLLGGDAPAARPAKPPPDRSRRRLLWGRSGFGA